MADLAHSLQSDSLVARLSREPNLDIIRLTSEAEVQGQVRDGSLVAGVVLAPNATPGANAVHVTLVSDPSRQMWTRMLRPGLTVAMLDADSVGKAEISRLQIDVAAAKSRNLRYFDFIFPGVLAFAVMQLAFAGAMGLLHHRKSEALQRLKITPLARWEFLAGYAGSQLTILLVQIAVYWSLAATLFGYRPSGSLPQIALVIAAGTFAFICLGLVIANVSPTVESGNNLVRFLTFPAAFLCGVFVASDSLPRALRAIASAYPLTGFVSALRASTNYAAPFSAVAVRIGVLMAIGLVTAIFAIRTFRWEEQRA